MANYQDVKEWKNAIRREKRRMKRAAYHEVGHALAMYLCYGNIKRIDAITADFDGSGLCSHNTLMALDDYLEFLREGGITGNIFKEVCYNIGGGLCEAMFCNKSAKAIIEGEKYKFPIKGMEGDLVHINQILKFYGVANKKDVEAMIRLAVLRLKFDFWVLADKIKQCTGLLIEQEGFLCRNDFYNIFRSK